MGEPFKEHDIDLLIFNYENLHQSIWENHKISWIVTSIFIPLIFAMQGYFVKDYFSALNTLTSEASTIQVFMGAFIIQSLALVWWMIMKIFARYNEVRINRLREIEEYFFTKKINMEIYPVKQYVCSYTLYVPGRKKRPGEKHRRIRITFSRVYDLVLAETLVVNMALILYST